MYKLWNWQDVKCYFAKKLIIHPEMRNIMLENVEKVQERLRSKLTPKRFIHTTGVRYTAAALDRKSVV